MTCFILWYETSDACTYGAGTSQHLNDASRSQLKPNWYLMRPKSNKI